MADSIAFGGIEKQLIFCSGRRRHTRFDCDWSSDVCSSDLSVRPPSNTGRRRLSAMVEIPAQMARSTIARHQCPVNPSQSEAGTKIRPEPMTGKREKKKGRGAGGERREISVGAGSIKKKREK